MQFLPFISLITTHTHTNTQNTHTHTHTHTQLRHVLPVRCHDKMQCWRGCHDHRSKSCLSLLLTMPSLVPASHAELSTNNNNNINNITVVIGSSRMSDSQQSAFSLVTKTNISMQDVIMHHHGKLVTNIQPISTSLQLANSSCGWPSCIITGYCGKVHRPWLTANSIQNVPNVYSLTSMSSHPHSHLFNQSSLSQFTKNMDNH